MPNDYTPTAEKAGSGPDRPKRWWWPFAPRHRHVWDYGSRTTGGWGVVRCLTCGAEDIY